MDCMVADRQYNGFSTHDHLADIRRMRTEDLRLQTPTMYSSHDLESYEHGSGNCHEWESVQPATMGQSDTGSTCSSGAASDREPSVTPPIVTSPDSPPPPRVYKPCCVCGDRSSGYHYGVSSCEGCKGFFRRSVQKNVQYTCPRDRQCLINKVTRSRCQFCRLQKCLAAGMLRESVRNDRRRKRGKERQTAVSVAYRRLFGSPESIPDSIGDLIQTVSAAHAATCPTVEESERYSPSYPFSTSSNQLDLNLWVQFSDRSTKCIIKIVEFAKQIPGFCECSMQDQITLIKSASMDVLVLRLCSRYNPAKETMTFTDGLTLNRAQMRVCGFGPITDIVYRFARSLASLNLDETEVGLLCAICILFPDRQGLEEPERVERLQEPLLEALRLHCRNKRLNQPLIFPKLLMKIADLRTISMQGSERVVTLNTEIPCGSMPPLISEMMLRENY